MMKQNLYSIKKILLLFLFISFCTSAYNQVIKGTILDKNTKTAIDFASIYFNGTFVGTNTDKNGDFELDISKYKLMPLTISALGYYSVTLDNLSADKKLTVYLTPKIFELKEMVIAAKRKPGERKKNLALFRKTFLGESPNSMRCKILNEEDISFRYDAQKDTLKAFASKPILIDNKGLGYNITLFLDKFEYCKSSTLMSLEGNIIFREDTTTNESQKLLFKRARKKAYIGSRMHFIRALWENKLKSEGFTVKDSTWNEPDYNNYVIKPDIGNDKNPVKYLKYPGKLYIHYKGEALSYLLFLKDHACIQKNGYFDNVINWIGKIAQKRLADALPFEYTVNPNGIDQQEATLQNQKLVKNAIEQDTIEPELISGQEQVNIAVKEFTRLNPSLPKEKIYIHTDRPNYMQGDTIWFKAYSWFGFDQIADTVSKVLYVDLLNPNGKVELKRKLLIQNGTSVGEFSLDKNITVGKYNIRAYTRWMQNEDAGEPFYQTVTINSVNQNFQVDCSPLIIKQTEGDSLRVALRFYEIDQAGELKNDFSHRVNYSVKVGDRRLEAGEGLDANTREQVIKFRLPAIGEKDSVAILGLSIKDERLTFEKQFRIPLKEEIDLQFFPEGGKLVNGLQSKVAFKAIGTDGLSREVKGVIKDGNGEIVTNFQSSHKGMGAFILTPEAKKEYTAYLEYNHRQFKFKLPQAEEEGCVMSFGYTGNEKVPVLTLKYSNSKVNVQKYVVGSAYGKIRFISAIKTTEDSSKIRIPVELFPEGVSRITVLDTAFKPECERLIYINKNQRFKIEVIPDSSAYGVRSKVSLSVKTTNPSGEAIPTNLSLAVVDKAQIIHNGGISGISAYKLLESELKGYIEDVGYYFKDDSLINHEALDLLLLTQGYRRFVNGNEKSSVIKYYPERSFELTGKVALPGKNKMDSKFNYSSLGLSLLCPFEHAYFDQTHPDSLGKFSFNVPVQYGKPLSILKAFTLTGKLSREKIPKEKSFGGDIFLDEAAVPPFFKPPLLTSINIAAPVTEYVRQLQAVKKTEVSKLANGIAMHLSLPEITVTGKDKDWYTHFEDEAKKIVDMDSLDPKGKKYGNLYDLLVREFGARKCRCEDLTESVLLPCISGSTSQSGPSYYYPIYVMNGQIFCNAGEDYARFVGLLKELNSVRVNEIKRILVLPPGNIAYHYADHNILFGDAPQQIFGEHKLSPPMPIKQSLVVIETYSRHTFYRGDPDGIKTFMLDGLDTPRLFYSPKYEGVKKENPIYDGRATLYWNPSVRTNDKGEAKVEFYSGDRRTEMEVIVNGIELGSGFPGQGNTLINANLIK